MTPKPAVRKLKFEAVVLSREDTDFIQSLREKFADGIHNKHTQIKAIEQLLAYLMVNYPDDWQDRVYGFLKALFPELADALYDKFLGLMRYNDWLRGNRSVLMAMSAAERRQARWDARHEAFGEDAEEIFVAQRRGEQVREVLASLESAEGMPVDQKLTTYLDAIHAAYGEDADYLIQSRQTELMNSFLSVDSVQDDLHTMPDEQRRASLRDIRRGMGMDEAALERWDDLDQRRDEAWETGQEYMQEKQRIESQYEGEEQQRRMRDLQEENFGEEAEIIRNEEAAGFYRYGNRRRFGRE
ncbi:MAG: hypothetical protein ACRESV_06090 [Nevskiales bacterium]